MDSSSQRQPHPFNNPVETGLRMLFVLDASAPRGYDIQRLVYYDYLLLHAGDVDVEQPHVHPALPYRTGEMLVRRQLIARGINLMISKELVVQHLSELGVTYKSSSLTRRFLEYLTSDHAKSLAASASWLTRTFVDYSDDELAVYMTSNLGRWGAEFRFDALLRGGRE